MGSTTKHIPVLLDEVLSYFAPLGDQPALLLDCTFGGGGHTFALLQHYPQLSVVALDRDPSAVARGRELQPKFGDRLQLFHANFGDVTQVLARESAKINRQVNHLLGGAPREQLQFNGILADLGISSDQLDAPERGFSFQSAGPLDMRLDQSMAGPSAAELLNTLSDRELKRIFEAGGVGYLSRSLADRIIAARPIVTTLDFAQLCEAVLGRPGRTPQARNQSLTGAGGKRVAKGGRPKHPATVPFQALRIAVNKEFDAIESLLEAVRQILAPAGRLAIISFHSLEDRLVARRMRDWEQRDLDARDLPLRESERNKSWGKLLTKKAIQPTEFEVKQNPRARSARLRVFERAGN